MWARRAGSWVWHELTNAGGTWCRTLPMPRQGYRYTVAEGDGNWYECEQQLPYDARACQECRAARQGRA